MASIVERVTAVPFDRKKIKSDFEEHILPHMPRKVPLLNATLPENLDDQGYLYIARPVYEDYVKGTVFEEILDALPYKTGRATFIHQLPGMTLRFHRDPDDKYHIAIDDPPGAFFFDLQEQTGFRVPCDGHMYKLRTADRYHTAVNADCKPRTHLVMNPYMFDDDPTASTVTADISFNFEHATLPDIFTSVATPSNTIEQAFFIKWTSELIKDPKCKSIKGEHLGEGKGRKYTVEFTDQQSLEKHFTGKTISEASLVMKQFGIEIQNEVLS